MFIKDALNTEFYTPTPQHSKLFYKDSRKNILEKEKKSHLEINLHKIGAFKLQGTRVGVY